jgi:hypothetical protein
MYQCGILKHQGLAVIGAGFAGLTAAAYAAIHGTRVSVFERNKPLARFERSSRFIHPRIYDWPKDGWDITEAQLPVLNWKAGQASTVVRQVLDEFKLVENHFAVEVTNGITIRQNDIFGKSRDVYLKTNQGVIKYDALIIATGFGEEQRRPEMLAQLSHISDFEQYWDLSPATVGMDPTRDEIVVVGSGDGALADLIGLAGLSSKGLPEKERLLIYSGDYTSLLTLVDKHDLDIVRRLESRIVPLRGAGVPPSNREYQAVAEAIADKLEFNLQPTCKVITMVGRHEGLDLLGTYAANRFLFCAAYRKCQVKYVKTYASDESDFGPRFAFTRNGPFRKIGENKWILERPGPADPSQCHFRGMSSSGADSIIATLSLTERPVSSSWSQCSPWKDAQVEFTDKRKLPSLPRLSISSEWADSVIQRALYKESLEKRRGKDRAIKCLTGLFRLYALLFERIIVTDANLIDGALLSKVIKRLDTKDRQVIVGYCRDSTNIDQAAINFLTKEETTEQGVKCREFADVEISSYVPRDENELSNLRKDAVGIVLGEKPAIDNLFELSNRCKLFEPIRSNIDILTDEGKEPIIRLSTFTKGLWSLIPQSSLFDAVGRHPIQFDSGYLSGLGAEPRTLMPPINENSGALLGPLIAKHLPSGASSDSVVSKVESFESPVLPSRTEVYKHLRKVSGVNADVFDFEKQPTWVTTIACWYNAAYNKAIAKKNGASAYDILWVNPIYSFALPKSVHASTIDIYEIGSYARHKWNTKRSQLEGPVRQWRLGEITLLSAIEGLSSGTKSHELKKNSTSHLKNQLDAFLIGKLDVTELINPLSEDHSPQRAIVFQYRNDGDEVFQPISAILIE